MYNNNNKRSNKRGNRRRNFPGKREDRLVRLVEPGRFCPDRTFVRLRFNDITVVRNGPGASKNMNYAYRSSAYDPDPALGTGAIPGFVELANMYLEYRVHKMVAHVNVVNEETNAIILVGWASNVGASVNSLSASDILEFSSNKGAKQSILGKDVGQSRGSIVITADGLSLVGPSFLTDPNYSASTSSNPSSPFYINLGVTKPQSNLAFGISVQTYVVYDVEFFSRRTLET